MQLFSGLKFAMNLLQKMSIWYPGKQDLVSDHSNGCIWHGVRPVAE